MGLRCLPEYDGENVGPSWLRLSRLAVRRLPGVPPSPCDAPVKDRRSSLRLPLPSRVLTYEPPAACLPSAHWLAPGPPFGRGSSSPEPSQRSPAHGAEKFLMGGVAKSRRSPPIAFLRLQRAVPPRATFSACRVCFAPTTLLSFSSSGVKARQRSNLVSEIRPPLPLRHRTQTSHSASKGYSLRRTGRQPCQGTTVSSPS
jgi:hypothetical protein